MKQKSIQSQTTRPCCTEPTAKDLQLPLWDRFIANLIDSIKMLAFIIAGYALFIFLGFIFQLVAAWVKGLFA